MNKLWFSCESIISGSSACKYALICAENETVHACNTTIHIITALN